MKQYVRAFLTTAILAGLLAFAGGVLAQPAGALTLPRTFADTPTNEACTGIGLAGGSGCGTNATPKINGLLGTIINIVAIIIGIVAVVMIMVAGFKFVTSGGDAGKVANAKNTILYAIIGLVIVVAAEAIVHFVINNVG